MNCDVGHEHLAAEVPALLLDASWSSKCTPARPASIIAFMSSKAFSGPPKPASASATIGANQSPRLALGPRDLVGALERVVDAPTSAARVGRIERLVRVGVPARFASAATCQPET
jgi:hypothetical protein